MLSGILSPLIARQDLEKTARAHLRDARILRRSRSYDGAVYLCGYAVEIALKARICRTLKWTTFPPGGGDFKSLFTHKFEPLLWFSGATARIKPAYLTEWTIVNNWDPELRYSPVGSTTAREADEMIRAASLLLKILL